MSFLVRALGRTVISTVVSTVVTLAVKKAVESRNERKRPVRRITDQRPATKVKAPSE